MTCAATQNETLYLIKQWIESLYPQIPLSRRDDLKKIERLFRKGTWEILGPGLTQETCERVSAILQRQESQARDWILNQSEGSGDGSETLEAYLNYYVGLSMIHEKMTTLLPPGMNEGSKCPPWSDEC